jgi:peptidoglycan/LPS O-acetylase OafA/YrhL
MDDYPRQQQTFLFSAAAMASFPLALLMFPLITVAVFRRVGYLAAPLSDEQLWHNPLCLAAASGCLIAALCSPAVSSILSSRPMKYLGKISYGLYLLHMPVLLVLYRATHLSQWPVLFLLATLLLSIMVATAAHQFLEAPARRKANEFLAPKNFRLQNCIRSA